MRISDWSSDVCSSDLLVALLDALSPADIAQPIRRILRRHDNIEVVLGEAVGVDPQSRRLSLADGSSLHFDRLVIATGSRYNYFAHPEWEPLAPGLRSIEDARLLRSRIQIGRASCRERVYQYV